MSLKLKALILLCDISLHILKELIPVIPLIAFGIVFWILKLLEVVP